MNQKAHHLRCGTSAPHIVAASFVRCGGKMFSETNLTSLWTSTTLPSGVGAVMDQFDGLEKHTHWGLEFLDRFAKFVKERAEIEASYAKQLRNLVKKFQPKRNSKDEDEYKFSSCRAFLAVLSELSDYAGQREVVAECLLGVVEAELNQHSQKLKAERKAYVHEGRKAQQHLEACFKCLESSKKRFERDCKEAERTLQCFEKLDHDINATKADVEKANNNQLLRKEQMQDSKGDYASQMQRFNQDQKSHYYTVMPSVFQKLQVVEERRIGHVGEAIKQFADVERRVIPIIGKCLDGMTRAADAINSGNDSQLVVETLKSGFECPTDVPFEDYSEMVGKGWSDGGSGNGAPLRSGTLSQSIRTDARIDPRTTLSRSRSRFWPFVKKSKLPCLLPTQPPPPPPSTQVEQPLGPEPLSSDSPLPSPSPNPHSRSLERTSRSPITSWGSLPGQISGFISAKLPFKGNRPLVTFCEDYSHLPPEQRRKKLLQKIEEINREIQKEVDQKDALIKMKDVYIKNPQMGDPASLEAKFAELGFEIDKLRLNLQKHETWLAEANGQVQSKSEIPRRLSGIYAQPNADINHGSNGPHAHERSSPDGSYTGEAGADTPLDFDDEFDDDSPAIGTCRVVYSFDSALDDGTLTVVEGHMLEVLEKDRGDGWTRVRRGSSEGYVPTSYLEHIPEDPTHGASSPDQTETINKTTMTYI
uniref:Thyroid hormone receptor interactor 10b n=1 Tax=Eptatretus burgeri TaxID=7764 RepID=A0A8C4QLX4_EPTBU